MLVVLQQQTKLPQPTDMGLPLCRAWEGFMIEDPDPRKHLTKCYITVQLLVITSVPLCTGQLKSRQEAELGNEWLNDEGTALASSKSHWWGMGVIWVLCLGTCWPPVEKRGRAFPPWKCQELCFFLPLLSWHESALKTKHWNYLKYLFKGMSNVLEACYFFLFRPKLLSKFVLK